MCTSHNTPNTVNMTPFSIGLCISYDQVIYTLAFVTFKKNGDVVISQPVANYHGLNDGTKFNPHVTYHANGIYHLVAYQNHHNRKTRQALGPQFSGRECLIIQAFSRDSAKQFGHTCKNYDKSIILANTDIDFKEERIQDRLGEIRTTPPTASFQVDLIEPGSNNHNLVHDAVIDTSKIIKQDLIRDSYPWCLVTIMRNV